MNTVDMNMRSVQVSVGTREVRTVYTKEMASDIATLGGSIPQEELMKMLKDQLSWERSVRRRKSINNIYINKKTS